VYSRSGLTDTEGATNTANSFRFRGDKANFTNETIQYLGQFYG
jgi:hypothetical protein